MELTPSSKALGQQVSPLHLVNSIETSSAPVQILNRKKQSTLPQPRSSWKSVLTASQDSPRSRPSDIELVEGTAHVSIPEEVLTDPTPLWNSYIVGHFLGDEAPHIGKVHATVNRLWQNQEKNLRIEAQFITSKSVLFRIDNAQIRTRVLHRHCWHISDTPMVVQHWSPRAAKEKPDLSSVPIWVDFTNVPDNLFSKKGLLFLGDIIGFAHKLHPNTERCIRLDVARVLVEVNLNGELPTSICLASDPENKIAVSYPWLPNRCSVCKSWGHSKKECEHKATLTEATTGQGESHKESHVAPEKYGNEQVELTVATTGSLEEVLQNSSPINPDIGKEKTEGVKAMVSEKINEVVTEEVMPAREEHDRSEPVNNWT